jgi:hypothetical protein
LESDISALERLRRIPNAQLASSDADPIHTSSDRGSTRVRLAYDCPDVLPLHQDQLLSTTTALVLRKPFALKHIQSRTVHPGAARQTLHMHCDVGAGPGKLVAFIWMLDACHTDNGATQFIPARIAAYRDCQITFTSVIPAGACAAHGEPGPRGSALARTSLFAECSHSRAAQARFAGASARRPNDGCMIVTGSDDGASIRRKGGGPNRTRVAIQSRHQCSAPGVPHFRGSITTERQYSSAIGREHGAVDSVAVAAQGEFQASIASIPDPRGMVVTSCYNEGAIR